MKFLLTTLVLISSISAFAIPRAPFNALTTNIAKFSEVYVNELESNFDFEGIVKLSNCSGSVVRFNGQPLESNAYVLTNGHCLGRPFLEPGYAVYNKAVTRAMKVADTAMQFHNVTAVKLVYGTMTGTDAAIYQLKETYNDLLRMGIRAFDLHPHRPIMNAPIDIVSGYWERGYRCNINAFIYMIKEAGWTWTDSIRYSEPGCDTIGGTSGSPIVETGTRLVVGINNTGNESGQKCTMNNPCEVDRNGKVVVLPGASYGQQTYQFYGCLTFDFQINLSQSGCTLTKKLR